MVANIEVVSNPTGGFVGFRLSYENGSFLLNSGCPPTDWFEVQLFCASNLPDDALIALDSSVYDFMLFAPYKFAYLCNNNGKAYISHNVEDRDKSLEIIVDNDFEATSFEDFKTRYL